MYVVCSPVEFGYQIFHPPESPLMLFSELFECCCSIHINPVKTNLDIFYIFSESNLEHYDNKVLSVASKEVF